MNFLAPWALYGLPLIALPIVIHLIHRRRQRVVEWGAMRFLLEQSRLSKGWQRLKQLLILLARVAAVLGLVFAISRPMSGGFVGSMAGGGPDTVICLLDRSASMGHRIGGKSRVERSLERLAPALETVEAKSWLYFDGTTPTFRNLEAPSDLLDLAATNPLAAPADVIGMFEKALAKIEKDAAGRTEIWVSSDLQAADWDIENSRWRTIRRILEERRDTVAVRILSVSEPAPTNFAVRVAGAECRRKDDRAELILDVELTREHAVETPIEVPLTLAFSGARTIVPVEFSGASQKREGLRIPIDGSQRSGFGRVEIPADDSLEDNQFHVVYGDDPPRRVVVMAEDPGVGRILGLAAEASLRDDAPVKANVLKLDEAAQMDLGTATLVLWQGPLPHDAVAAELKAWVEEGGNVLFLPSHIAPGNPEFGIEWGEWSANADEEGFRVETWRDDSDLLAKAADGRALPVGKLRFSKYSKLRSDGIALARFANGDPLVVRINTAKGGLYALATTPDPDRSNLATNGIVLIALVQRAIENAVRARRLGGQVDAGADIGALDQWSPAEKATGLSNERGLTAGVLVNKAGRMLALNRPAAEDRSPLLAAAAVKALFGDLPVVVSEENRDEAEASLLDEIWRAFMVLVALGLFVEALLSLERARPRVTA